MHLPSSTHILSQGRVRWMPREKRANLPFLEPEKGGSSQEASEVAGTTS